MPPDPSLTLAPGGTVVVVIPTFNERENLPRLVPAVLGLGPSYRILIVDDNSPDGTGQIAEELRVDHPGRVAVLHRASKEGIGPAYVAGFRIALASDAPLIAQMDADLSHDPTALPALVAATAGHDLVLGSRYIRGGQTVGWPLHRRLLSRMGGLYARWVLRIPIADLTGGFKVFRRDALAALDLDHIHTDGYSFQIETTWRALRNGCCVCEIPITFTDRVAGASKLSRAIVFEAALVVWRLRLETLWAGRHQLPDAGPPMS
jgi:dolichol-phosphate mannosyltransferase